MLLTVALLVTIPAVAGDGSKKTEALTVAEAKAKNNDGNIYWVKGYMVGVCTSGSYSSATIGSTESESNFLIADTPTPSGAEECMPVALPSKSAVRTDINLKAHPEYIGKEIAVYGKLVAYFNVNGIKETSTYAFMDEVSNILYDNELLGDKGGFEEYYMHYGEGLTYAWYNQKNYGWTASAFKNNACVPCESWLVSPAFDLSDATDPVFSFSQAVNKLGEGHSVSDHCSVWVSTNFTDSVGTATWTEVTIPTWPAGTSWDFFKTGDISLKQWAGQVIRIGFKYVTDAQSAPSWEIKNFFVQKASSEPVVVTTSPIGDLVKAGKSGDAQVEGTVVATNAQSFLVADETGTILVFLKALPTVTVGDKVTVKGETTKYNNALQFLSSATITVTGHEDYTPATPETLDAEGMKALLGTAVVKYIQYSGTLSIDQEGGYVNVVIPGTEDVDGSIVYPHDGFVDDALNGYTVTVTGYYIYTTGSKHVATMATSIVAGSEPDHVNTALAEKNAEWYDLTGKRVAAPTVGGLYIRKAGSQVTKMLVK